MEIKNINLKDLSDLELADFQSDQFDMFLGVKQNLINIKEEIRKRTTVKSDIIK